jgi:NAD(P)-dependent dehydrogenase (short-subunit alcohol dehydrogenase family)
MAKTIAVIGAGPGIGMAVARRFGREGFQVALLARNAERLASMQQELESEGMTAAAFPADVLDRPGLVAALGRVKEQFGPIDVVEYGPTPSAEHLQTARNFTEDVVQLQVDFNLLAPIAVVNAVLPDMLERKDGTILFCSAVSAQEPVPFTASFGVAAAANRSYAKLLTMDLAGEGIHAGIVEIAGTVALPVPEGQEAPPPGPFPVIQPSEAADLFWDMYTKRDSWEEVFGDLDAIRKLIGVA